MGRIAFIIATQHLANDIIQDLSMLSTDLSNIYLSGDLPHVDCLYGHEERALWIFSNSKMNSYTLQKDG